MAYPVGEIICNENGDWWAVGVPDHDDRWRATVAREILSTADADCYGGFLLSHSKADRRSVLRPMSEPTPDSPMLDRLTAALVSARRAATQVEKNAPDDGGSCNIDTCVVLLPRVRAKTIESASRMAGTFVDRKKPSEWWVWLGGGAQASLRTRRMEAGAKALKAAGFDAYVWYKAD